MWLEVLAASLFTYEATHSAWSVAVVSAARAMPLLLLGAVAGAASDAWNRRVVVLGGLVVSAGSAAVVAGLAWSGTVRPWHLALAGFVTGAVYATEFPARRRMIAESAGVAQVDAAVATDSLTSYAARCGGPLAGGLVFQHLGLGGAFSISCVCNVVAALVLAGLVYPQSVRRLSLRAIAPDLRSALGFVARSPVLKSLLAITVIMNLCGYSYSTLLPAVGLDSLRLDSTMTGVLVAAEPGGALVGGLLLVRRRPPGSRLRWLAAGVAILASGVVTAAGLGAAGAPLALVCLVLALGGLGSAVYTNAQTSLALAATPPELRSRVMGLITVCIGSWPFGMLLAGMLAHALPPLGALAVLACCALLLLGGVAVRRRSGARDLPTSHV